MLCKAHAKWWEWWEYVYTQLVLVNCLALLWFRVMIHDHMLYI